MKRLALILCLILVVIFALSACTLESYDDMMGTFISLKLDGGNKKKAESEIYDMIREVEGAVSTQIDTSTIGKINNAKVNESIKLDIHTNTMMSRAYDIYKASGGAFDMSIYPLVELWNFSPDKISNDTKVVPSYEDVIYARDHLVGFDEMFVYDSEAMTITKLVEGAKLDLGAVAKGYVADKARDILEKNNVKKGIVNIGGTLYLYGDKSFVVGVQNPRKTPTSDDIIYKMDVSNLAVSTSGDYERYYIDEASGIRYHHIIDPFTGKPADRDYQSVTVKCKSAMDADILSTTIYVMGKERGMQLVASMDESIEVVFISSSGDSATIERYSDGVLVDTSNV